MNRDLCFINKNENVTVMPLVFDGDCSDAAQRLMQKVVILMFAAPATDLLRYEGGGLYSDLKTANLNEGEDTTNLFNLVNIAVTEASEAIKTEQSLDTALTDDEKLSRLILKDLSITAQDSLSLDFDIVTISGEETYTTLTLEI